MAATTDTICTSILVLPSSLAWMVNPSEAAMDRNPLTRNSRPMMMTAIHAGTVRGLNCTRVMKAAAISSLSAHRVEQHPHRGHLGPLAGDVAVNGVRQRSRDEDERGQQFTLAVRGAETAAGQDPNQDRNAEDPGERDVVREAVSYT